MENILEVKNLTKKYDDFIAVDSISFDVKKGEIFGFLGPNGAGKTTTINMLIGMATITEGQLFYNNKDVSKNIKEAQKIIGVVADESNLYDEMSGYENLCFCGSLYGIPKLQRETKAIQLLELFKLSDVKNKKFKNYSKGMKRKLTIAASLIHNPEILFLDEPTTGIDVESLQQIRKIISELNKNGTTIFLTTHYIEEAEKLCNRIAFINKGNIIQIDSVDTLLNSKEESHIIEVIIEPYKYNKVTLIENMNKKHPDITCIFKNENTIKIISFKKIDISPIVAFLSSENIFIYEAKIIKKSLEDVFITITGIDVGLMKKEKEKK